MEHDLLDRAGRGACEGHVLHYCVALAQPVGRTVDEGPQPPCALHVSDSGNVQNGLSGKGAYERVGFAGLDPFVVGNGIVGARSFFLSAWSFGYGGAKDFRHPGHQTSSVSLRSAYGTHRLRYLPNSDHKIVVRRIKLC